MLIDIAPYFTNLLQVPIQQNIFQPPFDTVQIAQTHSALTSVFAGFSFAGLFLLIERYQQEDDVVLRGYFYRGMVLLFIGFIIGSISAVLYSSQSGEEQPRASFAFLLASGAFELSVITLILGMVYIFNAFKSNTSEGDGLNASDITSTVYFLVVFLILTNSWSDAYLILSQVTIFDGVVLAFAMSTIILGAIGLNRIGTIKRVLCGDNSFRLYIYALVALSVLYGILQGGMYNIPQDEIISWIDARLFALFLPIAVTIMASWGVFMIPKEIVQS